MRGTPNAPNHLPHLGQVAQQSRTGPSKGYVGDPATTVDVDEIGSPIRGDASGFFHRQFGRAIDLHPQGALGFVEVEFVVAASWAGWILTQQTFGIDELGVDDVSTQLPADTPKGEIAHILHRCQQNTG